MGLVGEKELARVRLEEKRAGAAPRLSRFLDGVREERLMAPVHAVEIADGEDRALRLRRNAAHSLERRASCPSDRQGKFAKHLPFPWQGGVRGGGKPNNRSLVICRYPTPPRASRDPPSRGEGEKQLSPLQQPDQAGRAGTISIASPVSTGLPSTAHTVSKRARFFSGTSSTSLTVVMTVSPILTGALKASVWEM